MWVGVRTRGPRDQGFCNQEMVGLVIRLVQASESQVWVSVHIGCGVSIEILLVITAFTINPTHHFDVLDFSARKGVV